MQHSKPTHADQRGGSRLRLVVHGDDFGLSEPVDDGIVRAHVDGILTSTSLLCAGDAFDHAVALARRHPTLDVGVHLALTGVRCAAPAADVASLTYDGEHLWPTLGAFLERFARGAIALEHVARELDAQLARCVAAGLQPTHLDGHQHLHALPGIRRIVASLAQRHRVRFVRRPHERLRAYMLRDLARLPRAAAMLALDRVCAWPQPWGASSTDHFVGFYFGGRLNATNLTTLIDALPRAGTCELMCHPGLAASTAHDDYDRRGECDALCDPAIRQRLHDRGVELGSFSDLATDLNGT